MWIILTVCLGTVLLMNQQVSANYVQMYQVLGDGPDVHKYPTLVGDFDGDGKKDLVFIGQGWSGAGLNIRTKISPGNGWWHSKNAVLGDGVGIHKYPALIGDINGDGKDDIAFVGQDWSGPGLNIRTKLSNGDGSWTAKSEVLGDGAGVHTYRTLIGDFNGDGKKDLAFIGQAWNGAGLNIRTKISQGNGTWTSKFEILGDGAGIHNYPALVGDYNGDGKDDIAFVGQDWNGPGLNIRTKLSNGDGTWSSKSSHQRDGLGIHKYKSLVVDHNGDGKDDLVFVTQGCLGAGLNIATKISNGDGSYTARYQILGDGAGIHKYPALVGDVNGDGKGDIVFVGQDWSEAGLNVRTKLSNGDGTWTAHFQILGDGAGIHKYPALIGDFTGDGDSDIAFVGQGWDGVGLNIRTKMSIY